VSGHHAHQHSPAHRGNVAHSGDVTHEAVGAHDQHGGHTAELFRRRFLVTLALTIPILVFSETIQDWFRFDIPEFPGDEAIAPVLGTVVFVPGARRHSVRGKHGRDLTGPPGSHRLLLRRATERD
jgi:Cu2+-exporting ATPase